MDTNYRANIGKWLPLPGDVLEKWFVNSSMVTESIDNLIKSITLIIQDITDSQICELEVRNMSSYMFFHGKVLVVV